MPENNPSDSKAINVIKPELKLEAKPVAPPAASAAPKPISAPAGMTVNQAVHHHIIQLTLPDKAALYSAYMPFVKHGGLFVRTNDKYEMGDEVFIHLKMMDGTEKYQIKGKVIWITPKGAQGGLSAGVGVQFAEETPEEIRKKIETFLAGSAQSDRRTDTM